MSESVIILLVLIIGVIFYFRMKKRKENKILKGVSVRKNREDEV
jgi:preprotein translocase subunit YajC